eukprot:1469073-Prymnesium_polylepis.1
MLQRARLRLAAGGRQRRRRQRRHAPCECAPALQGPARPGAAVAPAHQLAASAAGGVHRRAEPDCRATAGVRARRLAVVERRRPEQPEPLTRTGRIARHQRLEHGRRLPVRVRLCRHLPTLQHRARKMLARAAALRAVGRRLLAQRAGQQAQHDRHPMVLVRGLGRRVGLGARLCVCDPSPCLADDVDDGVLERIRWERMVWRRWRRVHQRRGRRRRCRRRRIPRPDERRPRIGAERASAQNRLIVGSAAPSEDAIPPEAAHARPIVDGAALCERIAPPLAVVERRGGQLEQDRRSRGRATVRVARRRHRNSQRTRVHAVRRDVLHHWYRRAVNLHPTTAWSTRNSLPRGRWPMLSPKAVS